MKTTVKRMCALGLAAMALTLVAGCSTTTDTTVATVTESQAKAELDQYGNNNQGYSNLLADGETQTYSNGTVSVTVKDGKHNYVSLADAKKIFSATLDGKTYQFPRIVSTVLADGWVYSPSNSFRVSKMEEERCFKYQFGENEVVFYKKGATLDEYGCTDNEVQIHIGNALNQEKTYWEDCVALGMMFDSTSKDTANMASYQNGIGINVGDSIDKVKELFGCWKYHDDSLDRESDLFQIYVNDGSTDACIGYVNFFQEDGVITMVNFKVNVNYVSLLM